MFGAKSEVFFLHIYRAFFVYVIIMLYRIRNTSIMTKYSFGICKCYYSSNIYSEILKAHLKYVDDDQFFLDYSGYAKEKGISFNALLEEV